MIQTSSLDMQEIYTHDMIDEFITHIGWTIHSTYHIVLGSAPGTAIYCQDMLCDLPYIADWSKIGKHRQQHVDQSNTIANRNQIDVDYKIGPKVVLLKDGIYHKAEDGNNGPYPTTEVFSNRIVRIQHKQLMKELKLGG